MTKLKTCISKVKFYWFTHSKLTEWSRDIDEHNYTTFQF